MVLPTARGRWLPPLLAALAAVTVWLIAPPPAAAATRSADRLIFWIDCAEVPHLTDAHLDVWKSRGVDGLVCARQWLKGMGGTQDFTGNPNRSLTGSNYDFQRHLRDTNVIGRMRARGMKAYLGTYLVSYWNNATPLRDWFDDAGWSNLVRPRMAELAGAARRLGFAGVAFDQELYPQVGGAARASWAWNYRGNTRPKAAVRAKVRQRGRELMSSLLAAYPGIQLMAYGVEFPQTWNELVQKKVNGLNSAFRPRVDIDFWDGLSSVEGYSAIRIADASFYKTASPGTWETANQYNQNRVYAYLSRHLSNWKYASSRFHVSPFAWIDKGPCGCPFEDSRPPAYVADQLRAFRKWGTGGEFANYAYRQLNAFNYAPYVRGMKAASTPAEVDSRAPALAVSRRVRRARRGRRSTPVATLKGTVTDNLAIRSVRWSNSAGGSGAARMTWNVRSGNYRVGYRWRTRWSATIPLQAGKNRITIEAKDIKGLVTRRTKKLPRPVSGARTHSG